MATQEVDLSKSRSGAPKRVAAGLLAGALAVFGIALAPSAGAVDDTATDRYAGATRYGTAAAVAGQTDFDGATTAILATGEDYPDALAASGLAGSNAPAPIVLTESDQLTDESRVALSELGSLDDVIVVGGTAAISDEVVTAVEDEGYTVTRLAGENRYETAADIAAETAGGQIDGMDTALIASGEVFADALAGGPIAYALGLPVLLVNADGIPEATAAALDSEGIEQVVILGGTARITDETETELEGIVGNDAVRVAGQDRFETSTLIADYAEAELGWPPEEALLASGLNFPDALSAGPLGGERNAPILLTASLTDVVLQWFDDNSNVLRRINCVGGTASCSEEDLQAAEGASETTDNDTPTGGDTVTSDLQGPELQSASISGIELDDLAISYTFTFDSDVDEDSVEPALFKLYNTDTRYPALGDAFNGGDDVEVDGENVIVVFNLAEYGVANATLAAVEQGAVSDENGNDNPAQSVATSGVSNGPSNTLVGAEITDEDDGVIELEWSSPQVPGAAAANLYKLILKDGDAIVCTPADAVAAGFGYSDCTAETVPDDDELSTTVEVQFLCSGDDTPATFDQGTDDDPCEGADAGDGADLSDQNIRRVVVESLSSGRVNVADVASGGTTDGPDLVDVQLASDNEDLDDNQALFIFDEDIDTVSTAPAALAGYDLVYGFCAPSDTTVNTAVDAADALDTDKDYGDQDGEGFDDTVSLQGACMESPTAVNAATAVDEDFSDRAVLVTFAEDDIDNDFLIAAQVRDDAAVSEADTDNLSNQDDEVELGDRMPESLWDDGEVSGPQVVSADVELDTTFGGDFAAWVITLTFDKDIDDAALGGDITFFYDDGENVESEVIAGCEVDDDTTVVCEIDDEDSDFQNATVISVEAGTVETDETVTLSDAAADTNTQFPNPEQSIGIDEVPEAPEDEDD